MSDLDALLPVTKTVTIAGKSIDLSPIVLEELGPIMQLAAPLRETFAAIGIANIWKLASEHGPALVALTAAMARQPEEWVRKLSVANAVQLFEECIEVNSDFFTSALPRFTRLVRSLTPTSLARSGSNQPASASASVQTIPATAGSDSSVTSSPLATTGTPSADTPLASASSSANKPSA